MKQAIDFLKSIPKERNYLPAKWAALALLVLIILLGSVSIYQLFSSMNLDKSLHQAQLAREKAENAFATIARNYPLLASERPLVEKVGELQNQLSDKERRYKNLTHKTHRQPFSKYLDALAEVIPDGLWLTRINLDQDSKNMSLRGFSMLPVSVSILLQKLQATPVFSGIYFDLFYLKKVADKDYLSFELANDQLLGMHESSDKKNKAIDETHKKPSSPQPNRDKSS